MVGIMDAKQQETQRDADLEEILVSKSRKKIVLAGPGTGKSYLLGEAIKRKRRDGKSKFHAITFLGKLEHSLADDLAGLSETSTLHSFARTVVLTALPTWRYYKNTKEIILEDLEMAKVKDRSIWSKEYKARSVYYKAIGHADVVYLAVELMKSNSENIPARDLVLVDEYQDFNEIENEFIELLATKNEILIVGDDDQALYLWKGGDPNYIREKHDKANTEYESFSLRWCNRCPQVIVDTFDNVIAKNKAQLKMRTPKDFICFIPKKGEDSKLNPHICLMEVGQYSIAKQIKVQLAEMLKGQDIKSVLVIGEDKSTFKLLTTVAKSLKDSGFNNVEYKYDNDAAYHFNSDYLEVYKILSSEENSILAWRVLSNKLSPKAKDQLLINFNNDPGAFINNLADSFKTKQIKYARALIKLKNGPTSVRNQIADATVEELESEITIDSKSKREIFTRQVIKDTNHIPSPLSNLAITVCNIMGSKGLGADVVFLLGFDDKKLPAKAIPTESEIYQFLVALTRTKKRMYLINTLGCKLSKFYEHMDSDNIVVIENSY
jgi:superfamily I DNA/RNA helicase